MTREAWTSFFIRPCNGPLGDAGRDPYQAPGRAGWFYVPQNVRYDGSPALDSLNVGRSRS
jgi:hypothetical protein